MAFIISDKMERWNRIGRKLISCDLFPVWMAIFMRAHFFLHVNTCFKRIRFMKRKSSFRIQLIEKLMRTSDQRGKQIV